MTQQKNGDRQKIQRIEINVYLQCNDEEHAKLTLNAISAICIDVWAMTSMVACEAFFCAILDDEMAFAIIKWKLVLVWRENWQWGNGKWCPNKIKELFMQRMRRNDIKVKVECVLYYTTL